jgi:poly(A) polymerase
VPQIPALYQAMDQVLEAQAEKIAIPRRYGGDMKEIWALQPRLAQRSGKRPFRLLELPRFRAGYDFLRLRCESGEVDWEISAWWERFQAADADGRQQMLVAESTPKKRRRRRKPKHAGDSVAQGEGTQKDEGARIKGTLAAEQKDET